MALAIPLHVGVSQICIASSLVRCPVSRLVAKTAVYPIAPDIPQRLVHSWRLSAIYTVAMLMTVRSL